MILTVLNLTASVLKTGRLPKKAAGLNRIIIKNSSGITAFFLNKKKNYSLFLQDSGQNQSKNPYQIKIPGFTSQIKILSFTLSSIYLNPPIPQKALLSSNSP